MQNNQYITRDRMRLIHLCLEHRKARGEKLRIAELLNEVIDMGLERYAEEYGIQLPELGERLPLLRKE